MSKNLDGSSSIPRIRKASIRVTSATSDHLSQLLSMIRGLAEYQELDHLMGVTNESLREALFSSKPSAEALLAFHDGDCAGFAIFHPTYCGVRGREGMFLSSLYIGPEFRDEGIGMALLKCIAEIAFERGYYQAEWIVRNWNDSAISFFRAAGAEFPKDWTKCRMDEQALSRLARRRTKHFGDADPKHAGGTDEFNLNVGGRDGERDEQIRRTA